MDATGISRVSAAALRGLVVFAIGLVLHVVGPDAFSGPHSAMAEMSTSAPVSGFHQSSEFERSASHTALRRRVRTRTRYDEVLDAASWRSVLPPPSTAARRRGSTAEAVRVLAARGVLVLSWRSAHRDACWGLLHAHGNACPPPLPV